MSESHLPQFAPGLLVVATPWIVVRIALTIAANHARAAGRALALPRIILGRVTAIAIAIVSGFAMWLPPQSVSMAAVNGAIFGALAAIALRKLHALDAATQRIRQIDSSIRVATLVPRRPGQYLPWPWHALPFAVTMVGLALLAWRAAAAPIDHRLFLPLAFALVAPIFLWLYEVWIWTLATGPAAELRDADRRRRQAIHSVFVAECVLVTGFLCLAHALLTLDWMQSRIWITLLMTSGGLLGVAGCALALTSDLTTRRYDSVRAE